MTAVEKLLAQLSVEDDHQSPIRRAYLERTPRSAAAFGEARRWLAGGVSRQAGYWSPHPVSLERGAAFQAWDIDGNEYIDLINNYGSMVHGHTNPAIEAAVRRALPKGTAWLGNCASQTELARLIVDRVRSVDRVRFTNSGAEAANLALMIARAVTGRREFLMVRHGYHGTLLDFQAGSFGAEGPGPFVARYNDLEEFESVLARHGSEIAAVFVEPVWTFGGVIAGAREFLGGLIEATRRAGAVIVFDEVVTFRLGVGGAQGQLGLEPDLTMFGKLIGGGFPIGAVGGRESHMAVLDASRGMKAVHSGTFNGNPVSTAAGVASVNELTAERIEHLAALGKKLAGGLVETAQALGLPFRAHQAGSILGLFFQADLPSHPLIREDRNAMGLFHLAALNHGLLLAPRGMLALSTPMTEATINIVLERAQAAMTDLIHEL